MATSVIILSKDNFPLGAALTCGVVKQEYVIGEKTYMGIDDSLSFVQSHSISRHLARLYPDANLYPSNIWNRTEVDNWLTVIGGPAAIRENLQSLMTEVNNALDSGPFLVGKSMSIADLEAFGVIYKGQHLINCIKNSSKLVDWINRIEKKVQNILKSLPVHLGGIVPVTKGGKKVDEGGKFAALPGAQKGKVVVRFPPEASGYLHIGHAKAALLNQYYQKEFEGKLIMRFDDTNPAKENLEFEKVILSDLQLLDVKPDVFTHTSDLFPKMLLLCEHLIRAGNAFADDTDGETMKKEREEKICSKNRDNSVEFNLKMWQEMQLGTDRGLEYCIRAKMDMSSLNGCLRDPTIYRCKNESHVRTGTTYKAYPTYDFACPIVDSLEGVTHALRTTEYHDRDDQYNWFIAKLQLRPVVIYDYSRLNMNNTVLSKRKLAWFVQEGLVDGWDDPRFPTVRGIIRRGMTVEGLKEFIISQGSSRSVVNMEWDKIWSFNKKVIDRDSSRYTALEGDLVAVTVANAEVRAIDAQKHPKDPTKGTKKIWTASTVYIEQADAQFLKEGENATFINWGNLMIKKITKADGKIVEVSAEPNLSDTNFKKTLKLTWLARVDQAPWTSVTCVYFDHLISKSVIGRDEDFKQFINHQTQKEIAMVGDDELKKVKSGDIIQLQRKGFFKIDKGYQADSGNHIVAFYIPDGHTKEQGVVQKPTVSVGARKIDSKSACSDDAINIYNNIKQQGDLVRQLKSAKSDKDTIKAAVDVLINLKKEFKAASGIEWKPDLDMPGNDSQKTDKACCKSDICSDIVSRSDNQINQQGDAINIYNNIKQQGDLVRQLKTAKSDKETVKAAVDVLISLKNEFKAASGLEWKPDLDMSGNDSQKTDKACCNSDKCSNTVSNNQINQQGDVINIYNNIKKQGDLVRQLKTAKSDKDTVKAAVDILINLKKEFKAASGIEWKPDLDMSVNDSQKTDKACCKSDKCSDNVSEINNQIKQQGDTVRQLKAAKADKEAIKSAVEVLLGLKNKFKAATGKDWKPDATALPSVTITNKESDVNKVSPDVVGIHNEIKKHDDKITLLKAAIKTEADILLKLKSDFKNAAGNDWTPDVAVENRTSEIHETNKPAGDNHGCEISDKIKKQGDKVRDLKASKSDKTVLKEQVDILLSLKQEFKTCTGTDWRPDVAGNKTGPKQPSSLTGTNGSQDITKSIDNGEICDKIKLQGDKIRTLKSSKADKLVLKSEVDILLSLKSEFKKATGTDWTPGAGVGNSTKIIAPVKSAPVTAKLAKDIKNKTSKEVDTQAKKQTRLCIESKKLDNLADWYSEVITKSDMIEYYNVSGCYILRPWSFAIWNEIKDFLNREIKAISVDECYFPLFVSRDALEKEKGHLEGFSPEVAWVTRAGNTDMAEPVAIRPTSETVIYPTVAKWIQSHRDLPLKLNQWSNIVRWEFKQPTPFIRSREFLWQEGHTAFATKQEALEDMYAALDIYSRVYQDLLAVPVVKGHKTEKEKFAGADCTTTVEVFVAANGRAIQGATSHHLGQNFSKMFDITFEDPVTKEVQYVYQNSWGMTTRTIGAMIMVHGDDKGLVLPPRVAKIQAVIVPVGISAKTSHKDKQNLYQFCDHLWKEISACVRCHYDDRDNITPGWKFNHWELKGVPMRIEVGPKEMSSGEVCLVRRDTGERLMLPRDNIASHLTTMVDTIHNAMFTKAKTERDSKTVVTTDWHEFVSSLDEKKIMMSPFCGEEQCEVAIKQDSTRGQVVEAGAPSMGAKTLCIPFDQPRSVEGLKCINPNCSEPPKFFTSFGRSY